MQARRGLMTLGAVLALAASPVGAQTDSEITSALQFNFSNPGAKSLAMAGALTGLGDDATGAWTNPGGLINLSRPEISFEFRSFRYVNAFTTRGHVFGSPTGVGIDTVTGLEDGESTESAQGVSFASVVVPGTNWAIAGYRHEAANFRTSLSTDGAFRGSAPQFRRLRPADGDLDLGVVAYGVSGATRLGPSFSIGAGVSVYDFSIDSLLQRYSTTRIPGLTAPGAFFGPPLREAGNVVNVESQSGNDLALGVNVGFSSDLGNKLRVGGSYRQGADFSFAVERVAGTGSARPGTVDVDEDAVFRLPDVYALGILVRPSPALSMTFDYRRVQYSQLTRNMTVVIGKGIDDPSEFSVDDGNELRAGVEYLLINMRSPVAIRGGVWFDPDHRIRFAPRDGRESDSALVFRPGDDEVHVSGGLGVALRSVQFDGAIDYSKRFTIVSLSAVLRF